MKKLFKQEWKYYLFFCIVMTVVLICSIGINGLENLNWLEKEMETGLGLYSGISVWVWQMSWSVNGLLDSVIFQVLVGVLLLKGTLFWLERDNSGREFLCTLPLTRKERRIFHLIMDALVMVIPVIGYTGYLYAGLVSRLKELNMEIPQLFASVFGEMIICIGYLLFLLGLINVMESLFVDGVIRLLGTAAALFMGYLIVNDLLELSETSSLTQGIYKFFVWKSSGGVHYQQMETDIGKLGYQWSWDEICYKVYYCGELIKTPGSEQGIVADDNSVSMLFNFANWESYIGFLIGYLVLAAALMVLAVELSKRQEASRQTFYFTFGRYLFSALLSVTAGMTMAVNSVTFLHRVAIVAATVILFIVLVQLMNPGRRTGKIIRNRQ